MPRFGKRSKSRLKGVNSDLVRVLNEVVKSYDITILEGVRSRDRQQELYADKKSKLDGVYKKSNHQLGKAVDIAPYPVDFEDTKGFMYLGGLMMATARYLGVQLRWGADWNMDQRFSGRGKRADKSQTFDDLVHFEVRK